MESNDSDASFTTPYHPNVDKKNIAVHGYDVVSYHNSASPLPGSPQFSCQYEGATWYFANQSNLDAFKSSPEQYRPAYGGFCSYAMSMGNIYDIDPMSYQVKNGVLYLNFGKLAGFAWANCPFEDRVKKGLHFHCCPCLSSHNTAGKNWSKSKVQKKVDKFRLKKLKGFSSEEIQKVEEEPDSGDEEEKSLEETDSKLQDIL